MILTFLNPVPVNEFPIASTEFGWYKREAKKIKKGESWITNKISFTAVDLDSYEIYIIREKDKKTRSHWLVEYEKLYLDGKVKCIPRGPVKIKAGVQNKLGYYTIHTDIKKLSL